MNTSPRRRRARFASARVLVAFAALDSPRSFTAPAASIAQLERQLALATEAHEAGSVRELGHRLIAIDPSVERHLRLAETFLALGLYDDLEGALSAAIAASPTPPRVVDKFRAQAAAAQGDWSEARARWEAYLLPPAGLAAPERAFALDSLARALAHDHEWLAARQRLDERLSLVDDASARLFRANLNVRLRQWPAAQEDFQQLQRVASDHRDVKNFLPRWERVERALPELTATDRAVAAAPAQLAARLERGVVALRAGLWENAAEDLAVADRGWPMTREPQLLLVLLGAGEIRLGRRVDSNFPIDSLPRLAASEEVIRRNEQLDADRDNWRALRACDARLASAAEPATVRDLRAEQARLVGELGFPSRALDDARALLRETPGFLPAQRVEIAALAAMHRWVEADACVAAALRQTGADTDFELRRLAGLVWQAGGKHAAAVETFTALLKVQRTAPLLRARARSLRFLQRFPEAADDLAVAEQLEAAPAGKSP